MGSGNVGWSGGRVLSENSRQSESQWSIVRSSASTMAKICEGVDWKGLIFGRLKRLRYLVSPKCSIGWFGLSGDSTMSISLRCGLTANRVYRHTTLSPMAVKFFHWNEWGVVMSGGRHVKLCLIIVGGLYRSRSIVGINEGKNLPRCRLEGVGWFRLSGDHQRLEDI